MGFCSSLDVQPVSERFPVLLERLRGDDNKCYPNGVVKCNCEGHIYCEEGGNVSMTHGPLMPCEFFSEELMTCVIRISKCYVIVKSEKAVKNLYITIKRIPFL
jgi:hypothetical protein